MTFGRWFMAAVLAVSACGVGSTFAEDKKPAEGKDKPQFTEGGCCDKAAKAGKECAHKCCVAAAKEGTVCEKCNKPAEGKKTEKGA